MPQTFIVDQEATFNAIAFLSSKPKFKYGTQEQDVTKNGIPKWEVQVIANFRDNFGQESNEILRVGMNLIEDPGKTLKIYTPVILHNFTVGVMDKTYVDKTTGEMKTGGAQVWYRCDEINPA